MQYRVRVKGREPNNAYAVARLYHEQGLVQDGFARRLDLAVVEVRGRMDGSLRHVCPVNCLEDAAPAVTAPGDVRAHHFGVEGGAPLRRMGTGPIALRVEGGSGNGAGNGAGKPGPVRARLVDASIADGESAA